MSIDNIKKKIIAELSYRKNTDDDLYVIPEVVERDMYKLEFMSKVFSEKNHIVIDCGAHIGSFSVLVSNYFPEIKVHSFEPNPESFEYLKRNKENYPHIVLHKSAVDIKKGTAILHSVKDKNHNGRLSLLETEESKEGFLVDCVNIYDFILNAKEDIFILKLDLEGYEQIILEKMPASVFNKIKFIFIEEHGMPIDHYRIKNSGFTLMFNPFKSERHFVYINNEYLRKRFNSVFNKVDILNEEKEILQENMNDIEELKDKIELLESSIRYKNNIIKELEKINFQFENSLSWKIKKRLDKFPIIRLVLNLIIRFKTRMKFEKKGKFSYDELCKYKKERDVIIFCPLVEGNNWAGIRNSTLQFFKDDEISYLPEKISKVEVDKIIEFIEKNKIKTILFNGVAPSFLFLTKKIKKENAGVYVAYTYHGSFSQLTNFFDAKLFLEFYSLFSSKKIDKVGFFKKDLAIFFQEKKLNAHYLSNGVLNEVNEIPRKISKKPNVMLMVNNGWVKNFFNQAVAVSLIDNAILHVQDKSFLKFINCEVIEHGHLDHSDYMHLLNKMDIMMHVSFSECSPMSPIEAFSKGIPCLVQEGTNFFENNDKLAKYLYVQKIDDPYSLRDKIKLIINNYEEISLMCIEFAKYQNNISRKRYNAFFYEKNIANNN